MIGLGSKTHMASYSVLHTVGCGTRGASCRVTPPILPAPIIGQLLRTRFHYQTRRSGHSLMATNGVPQMHPPQGYKIEDLADVCILTIKLPAHRLASLLFFFFVFVLSFPRSRLIRLHGLIKCLIHCPYASSILAYRSHATLPSIRVFLSTYRTHQIKHNLVVEYLFPKCVQKEPGRLKEKLFHYY